MDPITRYFNLISQRPELFTPSQHVPLCLDEATVRAYAASTGRPVGVVYDNSPYYLVLADLCVKPDGQLYTYARVIYPHHSSGAVVIHVSYTVRSTNNRYNHVYPFYMTEGSEGGGAE